MSSPPPKKLRVEHPLDMELVSVVTTPEFEDDFGIWDNPELVEFAELVHLQALSQYDLAQEELKTRALVEAESLQAFSLIAKEKSLSRDRINFIDDVWGVGESALALALALEEEREIIEEEEREFIEEEEDEDRIELEVDEKKCRNFIQNEWKWFGA